MPGSRRTGLRRDPDKSYCPMLATSSLLSFFHVSTTIALRACRGPPGLRAWSARDAPGVKEKLMTQAQLDFAVAQALGESIRTVHQIGFSLVISEQDEREPDDLRLVVDCPFCRGTVPYPGCAADGAPAMAECDHCDVEFPFEVDEVYATGPSDVSSPIDRHRSQPQLTSVA